MSSEGAFKKIAANRKAFHDYFVMERFEAGIALGGTEVKSLREGHASLVGSYAQVENDELVLYNLNIPPYEFGNRFNHDPIRPRKLLVHDREIRKLRVHIEQKGHAVVPLSLYFKRGWVKVELGLCRGKQQADKRDVLRRKTADREAARAMARS